MPTCILPTKTAIANYAVTPVQLKLDAVVETFLTVTNNYKFLLQLMSTLRAGDYTYMVYVDDLATCQLLMLYLTQPQYGYSYTVTPNYNTSVATNLQAPTPISDGINAGKYSITVAWA